MYRIAWKSKISQLSGNGQYNLSEKDAKAQAEEDEKADYMLNTKDDDSFAK